MPVRVIDGATTTFTVTPNSGYAASVGGTCGGSLNGTTYTTNAITANCTVSATFTTNPINGVCGSANGGTFTTAPTTNLCSAGTPTSVSGSGPWTWSCTGSNGGSTASCSATASGGGGGGGGGVGGQITNTTGATTGALGGNFAPSINADGTRIAFESNRDLTGGNADGNREIFLWTSGSGFTQLTSSTGGGNANSSPSINADGSRVAFSSDRDLTGGNSDGSLEIFLWSSGSGITQLTSSFTGGGSFEPSINADGTKIAFASNNNLTGGNPDGNEEIFLWTQGSGLTQLTNSTGSGSFGNANSSPSINADGSRVAFFSNRDLIGGNPDGNWEIFLWTQGSGLTQLTNTAGGANSNPSINADGTKIAFASNNNLTGGNPDGNWEIFLWTSGSGFTQLTSSTGGGNGNSSPSISADGTRIAFESDRDLTPGSPGNADGNGEIFLSTGPSVKLQASGSGPGPVLVNPVTVNYSTHGCSGKEMFLVLNAPAMGIPWAYLGIAGWVPLPANLAEITPYASGPADGTYTLFAGTAPAGSYDLYLGCDFVSDGRLNIDTSTGLNLNGVYDHFSVTVQ